MRIPGRSKVAAEASGSATSRIGQTANTAAALVSPVNPINPASPVEPVVDLAVTEEMPIVREPQVSAGNVASTRDGGGATNGEDDSDVFVCRRQNAADLLRSASDPGLELQDPAKAAVLAVTLFVYGWESVEPGPLSWVFPSLRAALDAVRTMRNAIEWCIVAGTQWATVDAARAEGAVLVEQNA